MPLQWWVVGLILGAVSQLVRASDTGYGEGTIALSPGSLQCNFDRAYYGDYYFNGYKPSDDKILSCMEGCLAYLEVEHTPYEISFDPVSMSPAPAPAATGFTDSLVIWNEAGGFLCNCPRGSGVADSNSLSVTWSMDTMGHVANAWGQLSWEDHIPYSMDTDTGLPEFSSATKFGSFNFWLTETVRHPSTVFFSFTAPRTQFCYSGCSYWDTFRCEGNYTLVDGDAFKLQLSTASPRYLISLTAITMCALAGLVM